MIHIAVRIRELASSNLDQLVAKAGSPAKMLGLLQHELQESIISLQGNLTRTERQAERLVVQAEKLDGQADDWSAKARTAMQHEREDLARSALLAREKVQAEAAQARGDGSAMRDEIAELRATIASLEVKLAETNRRIVSISGTAAATTKSAPAHDKPHEKMMDRITALEKRVDFAAGEAPEPFPDIETEIAKLGQEQRIEDELASLREAANASGKPKQKAKAKR